MTKQRYRFFQTVLLLALLLFLLSKVITNQLTWYINPRFVILTLVGILFLGILAYRLIMEGRQSRDEHRAPDDTFSPINLLIMLIPLLVGILIPAHPLGSATVSTKGLRLSSPIISSQSQSRQLELASDQRNILGWVTLFSLEDNLDPFMKEEADVLGFVYFDERLSEGQFFVSRIILSCCAADGFAAVMLVDWPAAASLEQDTWVRVIGRVDKAYFADDPQAIPHIQAKSVEIVPRPNEPYLYP